MIYCQACKTLNSLELDSCAKCGSKLMITVMPRGLTVDDMIGNSLEEHLLERISLLEYSLARTQDRFERLLEVIHRQATSNFYDQAMLDALIGLLNEDKLISRDRLETAWQTRLESQIEINSAREKLYCLKEKLLAQVINETFTRLISEGIDLMVAGEARRGVRLLEKASLLESENVDLSFFLGEYFYHQEKVALAEHYLRATLKHDAKHHQALLMLGIIYGDGGEIEKAKNYLDQVLAIKKDSFAAHYGLGRIFTSEGLFDQALAHFKRALILQPTPEMYFVVGHAYMLRGKADPALKHLRKAIELDPAFDAAFYHLGLIYLKRNLVNKAREHFRAAYEINPLARYRAALRARAGSKLPALPVFGHARLAGRRLLTSGDSRLVQLLRNALKSGSFIES